MIRIKDANGKVYELTTPVTIEAAVETPAPEYSITVTPATVQAGQQVTVKCTFEHVDGAWLRRNGMGEQPLNGPVATIVETPAATITYTLRVAVAGGYRETEAKVTVTPKAEQPTGSTWRRGVGVHMMIGRAKAVEAQRLGMRDAVCLNDWDTAVALCDAMGKTAAFDGKGVVMFREYINYFPTFEQAMSYMRKGWDKRIVRVITNESEFLPGGNSVEGILRHAELDVRVAREMAKDGECAAVGTFPVGNPDITKPEICAALYKGYADWWNNGYRQTGVRPAWDQHEYSPDENHIYNTWEGDVLMALPAVELPKTISMLNKSNQGAMPDRWMPEFVTEYVGRKNTAVTRMSIGNGGYGALGRLPIQRVDVSAAGGARNIHIYEQDWHETRCKFLFELCGFNLNSGGVLVSSETGIDKGGVGGFIGCGLGGADVARWMRRYREIWKRPARDWYGNYAAMPKSSACIFQGADAEHGKGHWGSYYVGGMFNEMAAVWKE